MGKAALNQQEAKNIEQRIKEAMKNRARQDIQKWRNLSDAEKLKEAGDQVAMDIKSELFRKKKTMIDDVLKQNKNIAALDHATLSSADVLDRMVAAHGDMSGVQSISTKARAIAAIYRGELTDFYTNIKGGLGVFTDQNLVRNVPEQYFGQDGASF